MQSFQNQNNVMESNDREKKQSQKDKANGRVRTDHPQDASFGSRDATSRIGDDAASGVGDVARVHQTHAMRFPNEVEEELRRRLAGNSICGGVVGQLTPECLAKIAEIERRRETNAKANPDF